MRKLQSFRSSASPRLSLARNTPSTQVRVSQAALDHNADAQLLLNRKKEQGVTRDSDSVKYQFSHPLRGPSLIVLDANLAASTPLRVWLSSGIRAFDHCVETLCSLQSDAIADEAAAEGLQALAHGLLKADADSTDPSARHDSQLGAQLSMVPLHQKVMKGASHGISHMLGPLGGVGHGETQLHPPTGRMPIQRLS